MNRRAGSLSIYVVWIQTSVGPPRTQIDSSYTDEQKSKEPKKHRRHM